MLAGGQVRECVLFGIAGQKINLLLEILPHPARQVCGVQSWFALGLGIGVLLQQMQHPARRCAVQEIAVLTASGGVEQLFAVLERRKRHYWAVAKPLLETGIQLLAGKPLQPPADEQQARLVRLAKLAQRTDVRERPTTVETRYLARQLAQSCRHGSVRFHREYIHRNGVRLVAVTQALGPAGAGVNRRVRAAKRAAKPKQGQRQFASMPRSRNLPAFPNDTVEDAQRLLRRMRLV